MISVPILQSSTASSCIWMILSPRWASSFTMGRSLRNRCGRRRQEPCVWCDYSFICCHETGIGERALEAPAKPFEPEETENEKEGEQA